MTPREETLLFFEDYLNGIGLDHMVFASTLLGIVREGQILPHDNEIDICVIGTDLSDEIMGKMQTSKYWTGKYDGREKYAEFYLGRDGTQDAEWGWVAISPLWSKNKTAFININDDECITMDSKNLDKNTWGEIEYLGKKFKCPGNPEEWLEQWYGKDWKTPKPSHWTYNTNCRRWGDI